jgi:hypothetical protein
MGDQPNRAGAKMVSARLAFCAAAILLSACAATSQAPRLPAMTAAGSITVFDGGCYYYSGCDTTTITLKPDGAYTLKRKVGVAAETVRDGTAETAFAALEAVLRDARFGAMPERMDGSDPKVWKQDAGPCIPHAPGLRVTRTNGAGEVREIYWDMGCRSAANSAFYAKLDEVLRPLKAGP